MSGGEPMTLPRTCIPCEKIDDDCYDWYKRHEAKCRETLSKKADLIFLGDSITHFWSPEDGIGYGADVWQKYYGNRNVLNLGFGFDRTQNMLWRLQNGEIAGQNPKMVILNAGTNQFTITPNYSGDTPEDAFAGVRMLIETLRALWQNTRSLVMAVFPRLPKETMQKKIDRLNFLLAEYCSEISLKDPEIRFVDLSSQLKTKDGKFAPDLYVDGRTHPNNAGYAIWAEAIELEIVAILRDR